MFSLSTLATSLAPLPPTPMPAMFNRLFAPSTFRRATKGMDSAAVAMTERLTNCRRVRQRDFIMGIGSDAYIYCGSPGAVKENELRLRQQLGQPPCTVIIR